MSRNQHLCCCNYLALCLTYILCASTCYCYVLVTNTLPVMLPVTSRCSNFPIFTTLIRKRRRIGLKNKHAEPKKEIVYSQKGSKVNIPLIFYILLGCSIIHNTQAVNSGMQLAPLMQDTAVIPRLHAITFLIFLPWAVAAPPWTRGERGM